MRKNSPFSTIVPFIFLSLNGMIGVTVDELLSVKDVATPVAQVLPPEERKKLKDMRLRIVVDEPSGEHVEIIL